MASEKRTSINFSVVKDGLTNQLVINLAEDLSGDNIINVRQSITTASFQAITVSGLSSVDLIALKNCDATNFIDIAIDSSGTNKIAHLTAGRGCFIPLHSTQTLYAKADTATCQLNVCAVEP